ncbi:MAG: hypothetical protein LUK37_14350 [Clostridia bacterium]|nr:hypothetical protein [Clostridia bacterium]
MGTVIYREYQPEDFAALSDIVRVTWEHDKFCTPKIAVLLSDTYLRFLPGRTNLYAGGGARWKGSGGHHGPQSEKAARPLIVLSAGMAISFSSLSV